MTSRPQSLAARRARRLPEGRSRHAARLSVSAVRIDRQALAARAAGAAAGVAVRGDGADVRTGAHQRRMTTISPGTQTASRSGADRRHRARARCQRAARPAYADRDLAGERRRPLSASERPARRAARSEFSRRRPHADRCRGPLSFRHDQARRLSVEEPATTHGGRRTSISRCSDRRSRRGSSRRCISPAIRCSTTIRCTRAFPTNVRAAG